jgi:hypothetical protein
MGFLDKAKAAAEQAASKANEAVEDVQTKRELTKVYGELGEKTYSLVRSGAINHPELLPLVERAHQLTAKLAEENGAADTPVPSATAAAAAAGTDSSTPAGGTGPAPGTGTT